MKLDMKKKIKLYNLGIRGRMEKSQIVSNFMGIWKKNKNVHIKTIHWGFRKNELCKKRLPM